MSAAQPVRAPQGAVAWTPQAGWVYDHLELPQRVEGDSYVLMVSEHDGRLRGVTANDTAPLLAVLRVEADVAEIVRRLDDLADRAEGASTDVAVEVAALKRRVRKLEEER